MIHDVDATLSALLTAEGVAGGDTEVLFDAPTRDWAARRSGPCVDAFLYDIREDVARRQVTMEPVHDAEGKVVSRRSPPRRLKLSYLLTAWTSRPEDEHRLLSALLAALMRHDAVPVAHLRGSLAGQPVPVLLQLALPVGGERSIADVWNALGGELKPSLDLVVVAPFDPARVDPVGPLVRAEPELHARASATDPRRDERDGDPWPARPRGRPGGDARPADGRQTAGQPADSRLANGGPADGQSAAGQSADSRQAAGQPADGGQRHRPGLRRRIQEI